jgi:N-acetylmuramoyl-L-alanine amidase
MADAMRPPRTPARTLFLAALAWFTLAVCLGASTAWAQGRGAYVPTKEGRRACIEGALFLRVPVPKKGGVISVAKRFTGGSDNAREILAASRLSSRSRPVEVRIPLDLLVPSYRDEVLTALFPDDERTADGWRHTWGSSPLGTKETWQDMARWFCGSPKRDGELRKSNPKLGSRPKAGTRILIPEGLLADALAEIEPRRPVGPPLVPAPTAAHPPLPPPSPERTPLASGPGPLGPAPLTTPAEPGLPEGPGLPPVPPGADLAQGSGAFDPGPGTASPLTFGQDSRGEYAVYRLQAGEALYSAVVVRFTGTLGAEDVNSLAMEIARRSDISDVTGIPVGYAVKIPLEDLLPQYLPRTSPRYLAWASNQKELGQVTNTYKNAALDGVVVILDPGHGGLDRGAMAHGVWEDSFVYDIACRVREALEKRSKARVLMTMLVPELGYQPLDKSVLAPNKNAVVLTHPWFKQTSTSETKVEVNLRWHLANQYFERLQKEGVDPQRVVFTSIHADSLHPSLRGSMFYVPGTEYRPERWCSSGPSYERFMEVKARGCYQMTQKQMKRSEGLSMQFTRDLEASFLESGLALHPYNPTRDHVIRGRRSWVPAVLRNSIVPCSVLIEVCNLSNAKDAGLIADPAFRQLVAEAYVNALIRYYS